MQKSDFSNYAGQKFGRLTIKSVANGTNKNYVTCECQCECGKTISTKLGYLTKGTTQSCGCSRSGKYSSGIKRNSRLYEVWWAMLNRCNNENNKAYKNYGGRGITVCESWNSFDAFSKWALANGYDKDAPRGECTIDRIDVNGNYTPDNCQFATMIEQARNKRLYAKNEIGCPGVYCLKPNRWRVLINVNKKRIHIGYYNTAESAIEARRQAELKYFL